MVITSATFPQFLEDGAASVRQGLPKALKRGVYTKFVKTTTAKKLTERKTLYENMGAASLMAEGGIHPELDFREGWSKSFSQHTWGAKAVFTKAMRHFVKVDLASEMLTKLKDSCPKVLEIIFHDYLEYGDSALASVPTVGNSYIIDSIGGDGQTLFYATHTYKDGGSTWGNLSSASLTLIETSIQTIYQAIRRWTDNNGYPLDLELDGVIFPPNLSSNWLKLSMSQKEPATANNAINAARIQLRNKEGIETPWLSNTADWYCKTNADSGHLMLLEGWPADVRGPERIDADTENTGIFIDMSIAHGAIMLYGLYKVA